MSETVDAPFVATLKGGQGFDAPWIVVRGDSAAELAANLHDLAEQNVYGDVTDAAALLIAANKVSNPSGRAPAPSAAAGSGEPAQEAQAEATAPARQRSAQGGSTYGRRKAAATTGGRGGKKPKLTYEEASANCAHGERRRFTKPDVDWVLYGCPLDKNDPNNCGAQFIDKSEDQEG